MSKDCQQSASVNVDVNEDNGKSCERWKCEANMCMNVVVYIVRRCMDGVECVCRYDMIQCMPNFELVR